MKYCQEIWDFDFTDKRHKELLLSNDGLYIFRCKFQLGNFEADWGNLDGSS